MFSYTCIPEKIVFDISCKLHKCFHYWTSDLWETGRATDRLRSGRPRGTSQRQDRTMSISHFSNRYLKASKTVLTTVGTHYHPVHPGRLRNRRREAEIRTSQRYVCPALNQARGMADGTCPKKISDEAVETIPLYLRVAFHFFAKMVGVALTDFVGIASPTLALSWRIDFIAAL